MVTLAVTMSPVDPLKNRGRSSATPGGVRLRLSGATHLAGRTTMGILVVAGIVLEDEVSWGVSRSRRLADAVKPADQAPRRNSPSVTTWSRGPCPPGTSTMMEADAKTVGQLGPTSSPWEISPVIAGAFRRALIELPRRPRESADCRRDRDHDRMALPFAMSWQVLRLSKFIDLTGIRPT